VISSVGQPRGVWLLAKHQVGAFAATALDFGVMVTLVEVGLLSPVRATAVGAATGAIVNFLLGRRWIFEATDAGVLGQAVRYTLVAVGSLVLNSFGEHVAIEAGLPYAAGRVLVAAIVGVSWNFPLHRYFVFPRRASATP
jgi:putative flippase GtrA